MTNHESTVRYESRVAPGVTLTLRKMSRGQRIAMNAVLAPLNKQFRELQRDRDPIQEKLAPIRLAARNSPCICEHTPEQHHFETGMCEIADCTCRAPQFPEALISQLLAIQQKELELESFQFQPALVRIGLEKIEGLEIDGKPATADTLIDRGDEALMNEAFEQLSQLVGLSRDETKNSESPTTSGGVAVGETNDTTAPTAASKASS